MVTQTNATETPAIRFYTDADLDGPIVAGAVKSGLPMTRCQDVGMANASDQEHLEYASRHKLVVISHDANTMTAEHRKWLAQGKTHSGVIIIPRKYCKRISEIVAYLTTVRDATRQGELDNQLWWFIP